MTKEQWLYLFFLAGGLFSLCGALFDWNFFMQDSRTQVFTQMLGRKGARVFYFLLGAMLVILSVMMLMGFFPRKK
jgi:immunity protein 17 of polymorphic toxin system